MSTLTTPAHTAGISVSSLFENAHHNSFNNSTFVIKQGSSLDVLYKRVAPNAILNAGGRADDVRCHPGTRQEVIGRIEKWRDMEDGVTAPICWLSGPAGAGKSAIAQTIAERCKEQQVPQVNFFFFREDSSRNTISPLVATLLHQIILLHPSLREAVATIFSANPLIFDAILEEQLVRLIVAPLRAIQRFSESYRPLVLFVDGLDEIDSHDIQRHILRTFGKVLAEHSCPFRLLVGSRDESQIKAAFNQLLIPVFSLYLNDEYSPERDIRRFVTAEFETLKKTHPLAHTLHARWPSVGDIEKIVHKSSGQFIYAATAMRFISDSPASPELSLERVQGVAQTANNSLFSHLDAIYTFVLSRAYDQQALKDILHTYVLMQKSQSQYKSDLNVAYSGLSATFKLQGILSVYNCRYADSVVQSCIADVTAIARLEKGTLLFYHASVVDYLQDQSRSGRYFADMDTFGVNILPSLLKLAKKDENVLRTVYHCLASISKMTPDIMSALLALKSFHCRGISARKMRPVFNNLHFVCVSEADVANYKHILHRWISHHACESSSSIKLGLGGVPYSLRYATMAQIERLHGDIEQHPDIVVDVLRPESASDAQELALWVRHLLRLIREKCHPQPRKTYERLTEQWVFWAVQNNIPLQGLDSTSYAQRCLWKSTMKIWAASNLNLVPYNYG